MRSSTKRLFSMVGSLVLLIGALVVYVNFLLPSYDAVQKWRGELATQTVLVDNVEQAVEKIQELFAKQSTFQRKDLELRLPSDENEPQVYAQIKGIAVANKVNLKSIKVEEEKNQQTQPTVFAATSESTSSPQALIKPFGTLNAEFEITGSYEAIKQFVATLETNIRVVDVQELSLAPPSDEKSTDLSAKFSITTYFQQ